MTHVSFSFGLHTTHLGTDYRENTNPFTGEITRIPVDDGLTPSELDAVMQYFRDSSASGPEPEFEGYAYYRAQQESLRFRGFDGQGTVVGVAVELTVVKDISPEFLQIIADVTSTSRMVLIPTDRVEGAATRTYAFPPAEDLAVRWPGIRSLPTTGDLRDWLLSDIGGHGVVIPG